ncbi:hypothetical protein K458DRAFT_422497, partial [Lentithecium fluviatile CBS 122367]
MHKDEMVAPLIYQVVDVGAHLHQCEGSIAGDDFLVGRAYGTPLHWAVMHRNLPVVQALTALDTQPDEEV